jgi:hypothetical protein
MTFDRATLALYSVAGAAYVFVSVLEPRFILSWVEGAGFLLLAVWLAPALWRRFRR